MEKTFRTPEPVTLHVQIGSGEVNVDARNDIEETRVVIDGDDEDSIAVEQRGNQIVVHASQNRGGLFGGAGDLSVHVTMPRNSELVAKLGSADLVAAGAFTNSRTRSGSGDISIEELAADATVETGSGDIEIGHAQGDLRVKSGSGSVVVKRLEQGTISTGSGDVVLGVTAGETVVKSGSGDIRVENAHTELTATTASGDLTVGTIARGTVKAKAVSGDVHIGVPAGVPVWTDISCVSGRVSSNLKGAGQPEDGQDFVEIRATTVSGDIWLEQLWAP